MNSELKGWTVPDLRLLVAGLARRAQHDLARGDCRVAQITASQLREARAALDETLAASPVEARR